MDSFNIINPFTKETLASHPYEQPKTIEEKIAKLEHEFKKKAPIEHTKQRLNQLSQTLDQHKQTIATLISTDMGKPITESIKEVQKCMDCCDYYEENAETIQKKQRSMNHIQEPLGIILGIMPWNYPLWQIIRYLIPSIVVGNACLVKPAFNTNALGSSADAVVIGTNNCEVNNVLYNNNRFSCDSFPFNVDID